MKFDKQIPLAPCLARVSHILAKALESSCEIAKQTQQFIILILLLKHEIYTNDLEILL